MSTKAFYIGLALIIISFMACVISFCLLAFGVPAFLTGAILVLLSNRKIATKLLTTLTPIALYFPLTCLSLYIYNYSTAKAILIPKNFEGTLRVVFEEKCGHHYDKTEGVKTLTFPESGILILDEDFDRHINYHYYLVDKSGKKTEIPQIINFSERVKKRPCVLIGSSGTIEQTIEAKATNQKGNPITYQDFYVYNKDTMDRRGDKNRQRFDSLTTVLVSECRQQK